VTQDGDEALLADLTAVLGPDADPPPEVLAAARGSLVWRTVDTELAALTHDSLLDDDRVGVRAADETRILTFEADGVTLELEVDRTSSARRLIGQVVPPQPADLALLVDGTPTGASTRADEWGRFTLPLPDGSARIALDVRLPDGRSVRSSTVPV
jgi:hypothetical protein